MIKLDSDWVPREFHLTDADLQKISEWSAGLPREYSGAIGGRLTFEFTPTSIGTIVKVRDYHSGQELDITDYDTW